jgi:hypothetical protein
MDGSHFVDWSAGWVSGEEIPVWRIIIEFEESGVKMAKTQIDCIPNAHLIGHLVRRAEQGLSSVGEGLVRECVREAIDRIQHQALIGTAEAESVVVVRGDRGMDAEVRIRSRRLGGYDGNDKFLYLKEVPRIIDFLNQQAVARLTPPERERVERFVQGRKREYLARLTTPQPVQMVLSPDDPWDFFIDESGDTGFKEGSSDYYTVAVAAVLESQRRALETELRRILTDQLPPGTREIKFGRVDRYVKDRQEAIYRDCIAVLSASRVVLYATAVHKDGFVLEKVRSQMAIYYYGGGNLPDFEGPFAPGRVKDYPRELFKSWGAMSLPPLIMGRMIRDGRCGNVFYDAMQWAWKDALVKEGFEESLKLAPRGAELFFGVRCHIRIPLVLVNSEDQPILWLAELAAREVNKHLLGEPSRIDQFAASFVGAGPFPEGHFVSLVDKHGRYTFYNLVTKRVELVLPD